MIEIFSTIECIKHEGFIPSIFFTTLSDQEELIIAGNNKFLLKYSFP